LRNRNDIGVGICLECGSYVFDSLSEIFGVAKAGVGISPFAGLGQNTKGVYKQTAIAPLTAKLAAHIGIAVVNTLLGAPFGTVRNRVPVDLTGFKNGGKINQDALGEGDVTCGDLFKTGQEITDTSVLLKEFVNAIENSVLGAACNRHTVGSGTDAEAVIARKRFIVGDGNGIVVVAYNNAFGFQILLQFFGCKDFGLGISCNN